MVLPQDPVVRSERLVQLAGLALLSRYSASRGSGRNCSDLMRFGSSWRRNSCRKYLGLF